MRPAQLLAHAEKVVRRAIAALPPEIRPLAEGLVVHCEREPDAEDPDLLGLFVGNPHGTELSQADPQPPQIVLYLPTLWDYAEEDLDTFREEVKITYLHELGHYLGWDEDDLAARGLG